MTDLPPHPGWPGGYERSRLYSPPPPPAGYGPTWSGPPDAPHAPRPLSGPPRSALAGFGPRFLAELIDGLVLSLTIFATMLTCILVLALGPSHTSTCTTYDGNRDFGEVPRTEPCSVPDAATVALAAVFGLAGAAATIVVYVYYFKREGRTGQSWGRQAMGIRLLDARTGMPIGGGRAFGRFLLAGYVSGSICYLGYLWMLWDDQNQTWHDKIMSTVVVKG